MSNNQQLQHAVKQISKDLQTHSHFDFHHQRLLQGRALVPDTPLVDLTIQAELDHLRNLKSQLKVLRTKQIFLTNLRDASSVADLPSRQQAIAAEVSLQQKKSDLRKTKAARASAEKRLEKALQTYAMARNEHRRAFQPIQTKINHIAATFLSKEITEKIRTGDWHSVESILEDPNQVDKLQKHHCDQLKHILTEQRRTMEAEAKVKNADGAKLRKYVQNLQARVDSHKKIKQDYSDMISKQERKEPKLLALRHENELQKMLAQIMPSLTGIAVGEVRANGISFNINATLFAPYVEIPNRAQPTHVLIVKFDDQSENRTSLLELILSPPDVNLDDLYGPSKTPSLPLLLQIVCARLTKLMTEKLQPSDSVEQD